MQAYSTHASMRKSARVIKFAYKITWVCEVFEYVLMNSCTPHKLQATKEKVRKESPHICLGSHFLVTNLNFVLQACIQSPDKTV